MHRASVPGRRNGPHGICAILNAGDRPRATAAPDRIVLLIALALLTTGAWAQMVLPDDVPAGFSVARDALKADAPYRKACELDGQLCNRPR